MKKALLPGDAMMLKSRLFKHPCLRLTTSQKSRKIRAFCVGFPKVRVARIPKIDYVKIGSSANFYYMHMHNNYNEQCICTFFWATDSSKFPFTTFDPVALHACLHILDVNYGYVNIWNLIYCILSRNTYYCERNYWTVTLDIVYIFALFKGLFRSRHPNSSDANISPFILHSPSLIFYSLNYNSIVQHDNVTWLLVITELSKLFLTSMKGHLTIVSFSRVHSSQKRKRKKKLFYVILYSMAARLRIRTFWML